MGIVRRNLFIVRHGRTEYNALRKVQGSGIDSNLDHIGEQQANYLFQKYKDQGFDMLISSGMKRSDATIGRFISSGIPHLVKPQFREISWGDHEGQDPIPELISTYLDTVKSWKSGNYHASLPNGESALQLSNRIREGLDLLLTHDFENALICSHGRTIRAMLTILLDEPLSEMEKYEHNNTGVFLIRVDTNGRKLILNNDISHLPEFLS